MNSELRGQVPKAPSAAHQAVAPTYLLLCLLLGGSAQGIFGNMFLQLIGVAIIAWAAATRGDDEMIRPARQLFLIVAAALVVVAAQLVPLPSSVWTHLGPRASIADGYRILGLAVPPLSLSLAPYSSLATIVTIIPALGMLCAIIRLRAYRRSWLAFALVVGAFAGIVLGALQVASGDPQASPWYLYGFTNFGLAVGFFANANHMAILMVVSLPFVAALLTSARGRGAERYSASIALAAGATLIIVIGIALNHSLAGYGLAIPVFAASVLIVLPGKSRARPWIALGSAVMLLTAVVVLALSPIGEQSLGTSTSVQSRETIMKTTIRAIRDFLPLGSGLGTFKPVYKLYEEHDRIESTIINHAHNDYAELALETGMPGILLILLFLAWWIGAALKVWHFSDAGPYARAASIASAALLVHSLVDFPLRTAGLSTTFAMCLGLLIERRAPKAADPSELWQTRHIVLK